MRWNKDGVHKSSEFRNYFLEPFTGENKARIEKYEADQAIRTELYNLTKDLRWETISIEKAKAICDILKA